MRTGAHMRICSHECLKSDLEAAVEKDADTHVFRIHSARVEADHWVRSVVAPALVRLQLTLVDLQHSHTGAGEQTEKAMYTRMCTAVERA
jgi:hypothetical protein